MSPEVRQAAHQSQRNEFEGIAVYVKMKDGAVIIASPLEGSPAEAAGLQPGDAIVGVEGEVVLGLPVNEVVSRIVGPAGTTVTLTMRDGQRGEERTLTVERAAVELERVTWTMLPGTSVGYLRIASFSADVAEQLQEGQQQLQAAGATGTVLNEFGLSDGSALMLAIERWLTPEGRVIWHQGIAPDGLPLYISATNTYHLAVGTQPAENYPAGWLATALAEVNAEPQIRALIWFIDTFPHDDQWDFFSLTERRGQLAEAAAEFEQLLQAAP